MLRTLGLPVTPSKLRVFEWLPEPVLVPLLQRLLADPKMKVAMERHAKAAPDEMRHLADEFLALARTTCVPTPAIDLLYPHFDPDIPLMPDGSAEMPLDWCRVWVGAGVLVGIVASIGFVARGLARRNRRGS